MLFACCLAIGARAQQGATAADLAMDASKKEKEKSDKDITDAKSSAKASTWMDRAKTYQTIAANGYLKVDSSAASTAYDAYKKVIELDKDKKGGPGKLAKEAEEALKGQNLYTAFLQQGVAKFQTKNYRDAITALSMAGEINTKDTLAPLYSAIAAQQVKDNATAKKQLEKYIAGGGKDVSIYGSLAMLYRGDNEVDKALATLDKGIALAPGNKDLANEKINIMLTTNRLDEAIAGMKQMVAKDPNNVQNLVNLGIIYDNGASKLKEQIGKLESEKKKSSNSGKQLTDAKSILDTYSSEVTRLSGLIKKQPKNPELKRQLTDVQQKLTEQKGEVAKLETASKEAAASATPKADTEKQLADLKQKKSEQVLLAKEYYTKALAVDPNNYDANFNLGVYYYNEGADLNKQLAAMDVKEYQAKGKEIEGKVCGQFKKAQPYFVKAKSIKDEAEVTDNLTNLENILKSYEEKKVVCID